MGDDEVGAPDGVREASDRWWTAHESGASRDVLDALWADLGRLCSTQHVPDSMSTRFGW